MNLRHRFLQLRRGGLTALLALASLVSAHAMSVLAPTFDELVGEAQSVVRGQVTEVHSAYVDTPQGRVIKTFVTLHVERTLKGKPAAADTVTLIFLGGKIGNDALEIAGMPKFQTGDREILFIERNGEVLCPLIAAGHGRYRVLYDAVSKRDYIARENRVPLESTDEVILPLEATTVTARLKSPTRALAPADFEARVTQTAARLANAQR